MSEMKRTPLYDIHKQLGAKMVPFSGWEMPVQYSGILAEHAATRNDAGLFDVSHMGEIFISGPQDEVLSFLERVTPNEVAGMEDFQVQYNAVLNADGGLIDDITLYRFSPTMYMICSNASNYEAVLEFLKSQNTSPDKVEIVNKSDSTHLLALQGPKADSILSKLMKMDFSALRYYHFGTYPWNGEEILISRTGYTGEDGFEIYSSNETGVSLWNEILKAGKEEGILPCGLGARDALRIEAKYPLYGHELSMDWTPVESGIGFIVKQKAIPCLQSEKLLSQKKQTPESKVVAFELTEPGIAREHCKIFSESGEEIGETTSGTYSPSLKKCIGMAYLKTSAIQDGNPILVEVRGSKKKGAVKTGPFIKGSIRRNK